MRIAALWTSVDMQAVLGDTAQHASHTKVPTVLGCHPWTSRVSGRRIQHKRIGLPGTTQVLNSLPSKCSTLAIVVLHSLPIACHSLCHQSKLPLD